MNVQKITITKRDQNYSSNGLKGLIKSIRHSLRMEQNEFDKFEYDEELSHLNRITVNDKTFQLNEFDIDSFLSGIEKYYLEEISNTENNSQNEKDRNYLRQLRKKLNDFSKEVDNEQIEKYVKSAMENQIEFNEPEYRTLLSRNKIKRINQKVDLLERYIVLNEKLKDTKVKNHTNRCKEIILVIPNTNKIPNTDDYGDFVRNSLIDFYKENFPDFEIKLAVSHLDETTPHAHLFLDLKNKNTNKYDFNKKELEFIKEYSLKNPEIKNMPRLEDYEMEGRSKERQDWLYKREFQTWKASAIQTAFYEHFNAKSRNLKIGLFAEKLAPSKERDKRNKLIEEEAKKPKSERKYNYYTKKIEDMEKVINDLQSENIAVLKDNKNLKTDKINLNNELAELQKTFNIGKTAVNNNQLKQNQQNAEIKNKDQIIKLKEDLIFQKDNEILNITNEKKVLTKENTELKTSIVNSREKYNKLFNYNIEETKNNKKLAEENKKLTDDNFKLKSAYAILTKNIIEIQKKLLLEVKNIFSNMKKMEVKLVGEVKEKSLKVKVYDFLKGGKETVSGLSAFLSKADYSDDILIENKILEAAKPQFEVNNFMSLQLTSSILDDATFKKENPELSKINEKVIKPVLKNKSEDDFINEIKIKEIGLFKDNPVVKEEYKEYVEPEKRSKLIKPQ